MSIAVGSSFAYQIVGQIGGGGEAALRRLIYIIPARLYGGHHVGKGTLAVFDGVHGVEQRLFVFLCVLVIRQRLGFIHSTRAVMILVHPISFVPFLLSIHVDLLLR